MIEPKVAALKSMWAQHTKSELGHWQSWTDRLKIGQMVVLLRR